MQRGRGGGDPFSGFGGDPFAGFGGFGGFGGRRSMLSGIFEGRNPFDDPFFTRPFGGMFEPSFFGPNANPFVPMHPPAYIEHQAPVPNRSQGPIIEELESDDEKQDADKERKENSRKHGRSGKGPYVEEVDEEYEGRHRKMLMAGNRHNNFSRVQSKPPQSQSFVFQSSSVSYGGAGGTYYTSSKTRRTGSDGVTYEESKEADSSTGKASHRISRGLHNKGHTVARKLNSDGNVDSQQILHNLEQDELPNFEQAWNGSAGPHLPGWGRNFNGRENMRAVGSSQNNPQVGHGGWALPSTERPNPIGRSVVSHPAEGSGSSRRQVSGMANRAAARGKDHHSSGRVGRD